MSDTTNHGDPAERDPMPDLTRAERRIGSVLRADESDVLRAMDPPTPQSEEEARFLAEVRASVGLTAGGQAWPALGKTALVGRSEEPLRRHSSAFRIGAVAATVTLVGGAAFFALRAKSAGPTESRGSTYLGPTPVEPRIEGVDRLPSVVQWADEVLDVGPYLVRVSHTRPVRLDESRELKALETTTPTAEWSCPPNHIELLPATFWVEVYGAYDPPGAEPLWRRRYSRP